MAKKRPRRRRRGPGIVASLRDPDKVRVAYMIAGLALVFGGSLGFGSAQCQKREDAQVRPRETRPSDAICRIEDREITYFEYTRDLERNRRMQEMQSGNVLRTPEWESSVQYNTLRQMIDMVYFDIRANQAGITVTNEEVEAELDRYRQAYLPPTPAREDRSLLQRLLDTIGSAKREQAFERAIQASDPNLTIGLLRRNLRQLLIAQKYVGQLQAEKQQEIMQELVERAASIRGEIEAGTEFADAARENSEHPATVASDGLIEQLKHEDETLPRQVIDSAFSLPIGEVSQPIPSSEPEGMRGVWLVTVESRKEASGEEWEQTRDSLRSELLEEKRQKVEAGEMEMPPEGNLTVTEEEVINVYEEADMRVIFLRAEDPMRRVQMAVEQDLAGMDVEIFDPELRAAHHTVHQEYNLAAAAFQETLQRNAENLDPDGENELVIEIEEARLRYLLARMWGTVAFQIEAEFYQSAWEQYQENPEAFEGFPDLPPEIREEQQRYFALALKNLDRSIEYDGIRPWSRLQRAQIDLSRSQITPRLIEDLEIAHEYSSRDLTIENTVLTTINGAMAQDDLALENADGERPTTWVDPVFPEDEMGLTLAMLDAPFVALIEQAAAEEEVPPVAFEDLPLETDGIEVEENPPPETLDGSEAPAEQEDEPSADGESESAEGAEETDSQEEEEAGRDPEVELPNIPVPEPTGPLTQELRDRLDALHDVVQEDFDRLMAEREEEERMRQELLEQRIEQLPVSEPEDEAPESGQATNLLEEPDESVTE